MAIQSGSLVLSENSGVSEVKWFGESKSLFSGSLLLSENHGDSVRLNGSVNPKVCSLSCLVCCHIVSDPFGR
jgi:hypothetical protein